MLIDTSSLPDLDDTAPRDDSGGEQKEKRPGVQDQGDEMESDNDTESNTNIIAADAGNINNNGGKYEDFAQKMIAIAAERKRAAANDGWKQHENVPPAGIHEDIKKSDSGIAVREGKEFRQRDEMVIESREITQPEATERHETHEAEQSQSQQETVSDKADSSGNNLDRVRSYRKFETERYVMDRLLDDGFLGKLSPAAVKLLLFIGSKCNDDGVCYHSHETMMQLTGLSVKTIKRTMPELIENKLVEVKAVPGKTNHYRLL